MLASFIWVRTSRRDDPGAGHNLPAVLAARRPHVQPIFQIKQSPHRIRQKTPGPISDFLLRRRSVLAHPNCHFRVVCPGRDEFPQCVRIQPAGSKELAVHRTVVVVRHRSSRRVLRGIYPPGAQPRLESWRAQRAGFGERFGSDRAQAHEVFPRSQFRSNLQLLWKPRQNSATRFGDQDHVFQPRSPESRVVQAWLNGHHLSIF